MIRDKLFTLSMVAAVILIVSACDDKSSSSSEENGQCTSEKPDDLCECIDGAWQNCQTDDECMSEKPDDSCECIDGSWQNCQIGGECTAEKPANASRCECINGTWQACSYTCAESCGNGYTCDESSGECNCRGLLCKTNEICTDSGCLCNGQSCNSYEMCTSEGCICNDRACSELEICTQDGCLCQDRVCNGNEICTDNGCQLPKPAILFNHAPLRISEDGSDNDYAALTLNQAPKADVTVTWDSVKDGVECKADGIDTNIIVFNDNNWNVETMINCRVVDPNLEHKLNDGKTVKRTFTASSTAAEWNDVEAELSIEIEDRDQAELNVACGSVDPVTGQDITISPCTEATTSEKGAEDYFAVIPVEMKLTADPECTVKIEISIANDDGTASPYGKTDKTELTFNSDNWNKAQKITLTGNDDGPNRNTAPHIYAVTMHTVADDSCAEPFKDMTDYKISVVNTDNDIPSVFVNPGASKLKEINDKVFSYIKLNSQPSAETTITAKIDPPTERCTLLDSYFGKPVLEHKLTFTDKNYGEIQVIPIQSVDNEIDDGDAECNVLLTASSSDTDFNTTYNGITAVINKTVINDDISGIKSIKYDSNLSEPNTITLNSSGEWQIQLTSKPLSDVTVTPEIKNNDVSDNDSHLKITSKPLVFTPENYNITQSISYEAVRDNKMTLISSVSLIANVTSGDPKYNNISEKIDVSVSNSDKASLKYDFGFPGKILSERNPLDFQMMLVKLTSIPSSPVTVEIHPHYPRAYVSQKKLTQPATESGFESFVINPEKALVLQQAGLIYPIENKTKDGHIGMSFTITTKSDDPDYNLKHYYTDASAVNILDDETAETLTIKCFERALCTLENNKSGCTFSLDSANRPTNNYSVYVYCDESPNTYMSIDFNSAPILLNTANDYEYTMNKPIRSSRCESNPQADLVGTDTFTCHAEGKFFYAKGKGKIQYIYSN